MSDKKHIDRLFQESFKNFEATPSDAVWKNIESKLNQKKKKRRVIPIWWRYAGVAALLLLLLTISFNYFGNNDEQPQTNSIADTENNVKDDSKQPDENSNSFDELNKTNEEAITDNNTSTNNLNGVDDAIANIDSNEHTIEKEPKKNSKLNDKIDVSKETSIAENSASKNLNESRTNSSSPSNKKSNRKHSVLKTEDKTAIALNSNNEKNNETSVKNDEEQYLIDDNKAKNTLNNPSNKNTGIAQNETIKEEDKLQEAIAENKIKDNTLTIEDAIDEDKETTNEEEKLSRWSIAPNAAPVYFSTLGEGSSIDPQFNNNSKTGDLNMSYGISASYAVNKKLTIRSGVNRVNLGYNTNNVVVFQSVGLSSSSALRNVDVSANDGSTADALTNATTQTLSVISRENFNSNNDLSFATNTSINQSLGYIEVPLEIQYNLSNKKFGVNLIGGFSSFFLSDNKIYSEAEGGGRLFLGEATNINDVSYSANFGLGLNYKVSKKIDLNLEPMFKYQINTFNNTSGDFQPFFIGVYSGFAIKF